MTILLPLLSLLTILFAADVWITTQGKKIGMVEKNAVLGFLNRLDASKRFYLLVGAKLAVLAWAWWGYFNGVWEQSFYGISGRTGLAWLDVGYAGVVAFIAWQYRVQVKLNKENK